jgi:hypothetical protein
MADKILYEQPLIGVLDEDDRLPVGIPGEEGARNIKHKYLKRQYRNDDTQDGANILLPSPDGHGFRYRATKPLATIATQITWTNPDTLLEEVEALEDGEVVEVAFDGAGIEITHAAPADGTNLPIELQLGANYTTSKRAEGMRFRLYTMSFGRVWIEMSSSTTSGSVEITEYIPTKSQQRGVTAQNGTKFIGFLNNDLNAGYQVLGDAVTSVTNAAKNELTITSAGVIAQIVTASGQVYDCTSGTMICKSVGATEDADYLIAENAVDFDGRTDGGNFKQHTNGAVEFEDGTYLINSDDKVAQIEV